MIVKSEHAAFKPAAPTYQLKIVLRGAKPVIWRRLQVPGNGNLGWLHAVLQLSMGWTNSHLHHFLTEDARYSDPRCSQDLISGEQPDRDENKTMLMQIAPEAGTRFYYEYDFGDSWEHEITVEKILPPASDTKAVYIEGARACPPEDCGGVRGYSALLKALKDPRHPQPKSRKEWIDVSFDPDAFDPVKVNFCLNKLKWPRSTEVQLRKVLVAWEVFRRELNTEAVPLSIA